MKSIYAARLALCELSGAGATIPLSCSSIRIASDKIHNESAIDPMDIADDFTAPIVEAVFGVGVGDLSGGRVTAISRQNAIVICQAARIEIEERRC